MASEDMAQKGPHASPAAGLSQLLRGSLVTRLIHVAATLADFLRGGPKSCHELAASLRVDPEALYSASAERLFKAGPLLPRSMKRSIPYTPWRNDTERPRARIVPSDPSKLDAPGRSVLRAPEPALLSRASSC